MEFMDEHGPHGAMAVWRLSFAGYLPMTSGFDPLVFFYRTTNAMAYGCRFRLSLRRKAPVGRCDAIVGWDVLFIDPGSKEGRRDGKTMDARAAAVRHQK
ncbi:hypothetical protein [Caenibacillus caldisaponilyticus]|uniref:hypothetical protein n=1 Tax=Caenibacillus caldisaponilyticus TaxID=1674942 RepID=UPI001177CCE2|nr:hypothetical protein [Caenibacillus caldisaponilyticus]